MPYWRLYYHVIWSTKCRDPWLVDDLPLLIENAMRNRLHALGVLIHGIALMPDHVHLAVSISPSRSIALVVSQSKGLPLFSFGNNTPSRTTSARSPGRRDTACCPSARRPFRPCLAT